MFREDYYLRNRVSQKDFYEFRDRVVELVGDLEKSHIIKSKEEIEELFEGVEVYYESKEIKEWIQTLKKILLGDKK